MYRNISKKEFPISFWDFYKLPRKKQNGLMNIWWSSITTYNLKKDYECSSQFLSDMVCSVVVCDSDTAHHLYGRAVNPVTISIHPQHRSGKFFDLAMKVYINSCDDSSYGIWFYGKNYDEYISLRRKVLDYIDTHKDCLNGEALLTYCEDFGGVDKDYN